jgi:hypothetical protein
MCVGRCMKAGIGNITLSSRFQARVRRLDLRKLANQQSRWRPPERNEQKNQEEITMHVRHQHGHLRSVERKAGPPVWEFLWRETDQSGNRIRRNP